MNLLSDRYRITKLEEEVQNLKNQFIGEVYWRYSWLKFTKKELVDKVKDYFKIGIEEEWCPIWFDKKDVIIYDEISPFNKVINQIKANRENQNKKEQ
jgi:hypothetical protein